MKKPALFKIVFIVLSCLLIFPTTLFARFSILDHILKSQEAIVSINSTNVDIMNKPPQRIAIDRKTGKIFVQRKAPTAMYTRFGAGVLIHPHGIIATNAHTVNKANVIIVAFHDKTQVRARVLAIANNLDIALIQAPLPYPIKPVEMADSDQIHLGNEIITVGNSEFLKQTISGGTIIGIGTNRTMKRSGHNRTDLIQTTVNLYSGDSGGPLFDKNGRLIGLMTASETAADHSSFAVPSNKIKQFLDEYLNKLNE